MSSAVLLHLITYGAIATFVAVVAYKFMKRAAKYPEYGTLVRWFNTSWLQITLFIALVLVLIHLLVIIGRDIGNLYKKMQE